MAKKTTAPTIKRETRHFRSTTGPIPGSQHAVDTLSGMGWPEVSIASQSDEPVTVTLMIGRGAVVGSGLSLDVVATPSGSATFNLDPTTGEPTIVATDTCRDIVVLTSRSTAVEAVSLDGGASEVDPGTYNLPSPERILPGPGEPRARIQMSTLRLTLGQVATAA